MLEAWLWEVVRGVGRMFLNPILYWGIVLMVFASYLRIKRERRDFGISVHGMLIETKDTWLLMLIGGVTVTAVLLGAGFVFSYETILILNLSVILLSIGISYSFLSAAYTIPLAAAVLYFIPFGYGTSGFLNNAVPHQTNFIGLAVLAGLLLIFEGIMLARIKQDATQPSLTLGKRGKWIGRHVLKKITFIPFFTLIPFGLIEPFAAYWPSVTIGGNSFGLMLIPLVIGFNYRVQGHHPMQMKKYLAKRIIWLGIIVVAVAASSLWYPLLAGVALGLAFLGKEWVHYRFKKRDFLPHPYFSGTNNGLEVLGVLADSPAERIHIQVGELIAKVNGLPLSQPDQLHHALQTSGSFCRIEIIGLDGEKRIEQTALYDSDHHHLGLLFVRAPYHNKNTIQSDFPHADAE